MAKLPWGHQSRKCCICGKVGPRTFCKEGYAHKKCLEKRPSLKWKTKEKA